MSEFESPQAQQMNASFWENRIRDLVRSGVSRDDLVRRLVASGAEESEAQSMVDTYYDSISREVAGETWDFNSLLPIAGAGLAAAIIGGIAWGLLVKTTDYELGIVAWGIGALAGFAVLWAARGRMGTPIQLIAVVAAVLGIALGKYVGYIFVVKDAAEEFLGPGVADRIKFLSIDSVRAFIEDLDLVLSAFDLLWIALAVITAWRVPMKQWQSRTGQI